MRRPYRRLALLGFTALMTVLALVSVHIRPANAGCFAYCTDWGPNGDCCFFSGRTYNRLHRQCTDGLGHYCDEYMCGTQSPCAV